MPRFIPRVFDLFSSGFSHIAYLIAVIYQALRLLPYGHPYADPRNRGRYGIRHVIGEAANNLVFSRKNIDQIIIFFTILIGMVLLLAQIALLIVAVVAQQPAFALSANDILSSTSQYNPGPGQDISFIIMDRIFGIENIFRSCVSTDPHCLDMEGYPLPPNPPYPYPFHLALHALLRFYSLGIFAVSVFIILYFVITVVAETAVTGTAFGQRFNETWAPVRLILFFALLVPLNIGGVNGGLNGAQIITFWTAKIGSNFATNAWGKFNADLTGTYLGRAEDMIATPTVPEIGPLLQFIFVSKTCKVAEEAAHEHLRDGKDQKPNGVQAYLVGAGANVLPFETTSFTAAVNHANKGSITVRFGAYDPDNKDYASFKGNVFPHCGEIKIPVTMLDKPGEAESGSAAIQELYYTLVQRMWNDTEITSRAACIVANITKLLTIPGCKEPDKSFALDRITHYQNYLTNSIPPLINQQISNGNWNVNAELQRRGWAGAAIWYNRIARLNGDVTTAIYAIPKPNRYPYLMEEIVQQRKMNNEDIDAKDAFNPRLADGQEIRYPEPSASYKTIAPAMHAAFAFWEEGQHGNSQFSDHTGNVFIDTVNLIFGTRGIFDMRRNTDIHPLAQLSALGKGMMEASIRNLFAGLVGEGASKILPDYIGKLALAAGTFLNLVGTATLAMSFALFYVLPFLPFIYFIFAVSGWVKSIFEAIVAMPLWALAHICRMDGEGLPGPAATNGYFLLLEIFLRPILIVFGLLCSIIIFSSMVDILNNIFDLIVRNVAGFNSAGDYGGSFDSTMAYMRAPLDEFFFTAMYVILCYMMGLSCFKLIDLIPNNILRWAGVSIATFQENAGDPAGELSSKSYSGVLLLTNQIKGGALAALAK